MKNGVPVVMKRLFTVSIVKILQSGSFAFVVVVVGVFFDVR